MAHLHIHTLPNDIETSIQIVDPDNEELHWHTVDDERTSTDAFGEGHTHTINDETTSPPIETDINKGNEMSKQETKCIGGKVVEVKETERNGVKVGIVKGYIATWDLDLGAWGLRDRFMPGAFAKSILEHQSKGRQIRFKDHHGRTIGGFPPMSVREDEKGLFGEGEINLEVLQGHEAFSLARQGVLTDFSVGFTSLADTESTVVGERVRSITEAILWEGSIVDEPMNPEARITEVKDDDEKQHFTVDDIKEWTKRDVEKFLRNTGMITKSAAKTLTGRFDIKQVDTENKNDFSELFKEIKGFKEFLTKKK